MKLKSIYQRILESAIHVPGNVLGLATAVLAFSTVLFFSLGQEFVPTLDEHDIAVQVTRIPSTALTQSTKMQQEVEIALGALPEVRTVFSKTGTAEMASDPMPPDASDTFVMLHPKSLWPNPNKSKSELISEMEEVLKALIGNSFEFTQPIEMRFNELIAGVKSDVAVKIFGDDFELLSIVGENIAQVLKTIKGSADIIVEPIEGMTLFDLKPNTTYLSRFGIHRFELYKMVQTALGGLKVGNIRQGDRRFDLVVKLKESLRHDENYLATLPIYTPKGPVPLREVASFEMNEGLNQISREDGKRRLVVQSNVRGRDVGSFVEELKEKIDRKVNVPTGCWVCYGGEFEHLVSGKKRLMVVIPAALILVLALLFWALKSVRLSLIVFSGVPLALTGGIGALWMINMPFSISAAVGLIALSGIAVLNALVLMSAIQRFAEQGLSLRQAVIEGCVERLRPVLITALVASLGFLPMALSQGAGAEVQRPLAIVVIGGLISSTFLTLIVLPSLAVFFAHSKKNK